MRGRVLLLLFLICLMAAYQAATTTRPTDASGPVWNTAVLALALTGIYLTGVGGVFKAVERVLNFFERRVHR